MKASSDRQRRSRYLPDANNAPSAMTPRKLGYLLWVAECGVISLPQLARLAGEHPKATTRQMRGLLDMQAVSVIALPRAAFSNLAQDNDAHLLGGSAPNLYRLTRRGGQLLQEADLADPAMLTPYGPRNALFLAHHLEVLDVKIWLASMALAMPMHRLETWTMGEAAAIKLGSSNAPKAVRPDAWFAYRLPQGVLVGLVEVDRGTERGGRRWLDKIAGYSALFCSTRIHEISGYRNARLLVLVPTTARREHLATFLAQHAPEDLLARTWLAERSFLDTLDFTAPCWQQPGSQLLKALIISSGTEQ
jgi:hypothetical protein